MKKRNLDGIYVRVERDGKFANVCLTDLKQHELDIFLNRLNPSGLTTTLEHLNKQLLSLSSECLMENELRAVVRQVALLLRSVGDKYDVNVITSK